MSIRAICEKANCNVSAISYHFGGKDELYKACLSEEGNNILHFMETILTEPLNLDDFKAKLRLYMIHHFENSVKNRELILMISRDVSSKAAMANIHTIFRNVPDKMNEFFVHAQKKGLIKPEVKTDYLGDYFLSPIFMQVLFAEKLREPKDVNDAHFREQFVTELMENLLNGLLVG